MIDHKPPGSYILRDIFDVAVPEPVSWMPQALGWQILLFIASCAGAYFAYRYARRWFQNRYRRQAIVALQQFDPAEQSAAETLFSIMKGMLIHLDALHAPLFAEQFLACLDNYPSHNDRPFTSQLGQAWLNSIVVESSCLSFEQYGQLRTMCLLWANSHQTGTL